MSLTGDEIRHRLSTFAAKWSVYAGGERSEAQTYLNELFACYGQERDAVARFEEPQAGRFLDLIWPTVCIVEMKAPAEADRLARPREPLLHPPHLYDRRKERRAAGPDELRDFLLQSVWCLFAEDLGQLPSHAFTRIVDGLLASPSRSSADDLGGLFTVLNDPSPARPPHGLYVGVPYADGGLFESPAHVHLAPDELRHLREAAGFNWRLVRSLRLRLAPAGGG